MVKFSENRQSLLIFLKRFLLVIDLIQIFANNYDGETIQKPGESKSSG